MDKQLDDISIRWNIRGGVISRENYELSFEGNEYELEVFIYEVIKNITHIHKIGTVWN